jgi:hypothetical protein
MFAQGIGTAAHKEQTSPAMILKRDLSGSE